MQSQVEQTLRREGEIIVWSHRLLGDGAEAWLLYEGAASFLVRMLRLMLGESWAPVCVSFPHACRGRRSIYEDYFRAPVLFGRHAEARLTLPVDVMARTIGPAGPGGPSGLGQPEHADLAAFEPGAWDAEVAVARIVDALLPEGGIGLPRIAAVTHA